MNSKEIVKVTNRSLYIHKYSMDVLEQNINNLNTKSLLSTQILTPEFCVKYILDLDIDNGSEDSYIFDKNYILKKQPHITESEFDIAYNLYYNN